MKDVDKNSENDLQRRKDRSILKVFRGKQA